MRLAVALALALAALAAPAAADNDDPLAAQASADFKAGNYAAAATGFQKAYAIRPDASYLFDAAQAYRLAGACEQALAYYNRFLAAVPKPPNLALVQGWLDEQRKCVAAHSVMHPYSPTPGAPGAPGTPGQPDVDHLAAPPPQPESDSHVLFYTAAGVSAIAFGFAGYFTYDASHLASERDTQLAGCSPAKPCDAGAIRNLDNRGHTAATVAVTSYIAGGIAAAGAIALRAFGEREAPIDLSLAPGGRGVVVGHAFSW